jgi:hypothetical protein
VSLDDEALVWPVGQGMVGDDLVAVTDEESGFGLADPDFTPGVFRWRRVSAPGVADEAIPRHPPALQDQGPVGP